MVRNTSVNNTKKKIPNKYNGIILLIYNTINDNNTETYTDVTVLKYRVLNNPKNLLTLFISITVV